MTKRVRKPLYNWSVAVTRIPNGEPYFIGQVHSTTERGARTKANKELNARAFKREEVSFIRHSVVTRFNGKNFVVIYQ